jgi:hypothetical protein
MRTATLIILALVPALAIDAPRIEINRKTVLTFYHGFVKLYKSPRFVDPALAAMCTHTPEIIAKAKDRNGPHFDAVVNIFTNEPAFSSIDREKYPLPVGFVVVKEKLGRPDSVVGVGGMIKREPGFDPTNGDWEYFYSDTKDGFAIGKLQNCSTCHARAKSTDYVFSKAEPEAKSRTKPRK